MIRRFLFSCVVIVMSATGAFAHHTIAGRAHTMATVSLPAGLMAAGKALPAGTYEVIVTDERPALEAGTPSENQRWVEFVQNKTIVAREIAELSAPDDRPIGTSGSADAGRTRAVVQPLQGGEFVRIAVSDGGARYLIHLPQAAAAPGN